MCVVFQICQEWINMCTAINIPLSKSDDPVVREFLHKRVINGGSIPKSNQLRERYLPSVYEQKKTELKNLIDGKPLVVIFDETPDVEGRCVLNILFAPLELDEKGLIRAYVVDTVFLETCNHQTVSQAVVKTLQDYGVENENVIAFETDNAAYMIKAYKTVLKVLFPNSLHITCMAHIMNLVGEAFRKPFVELNQFVMCFSQMFFMAGSRKRRYLKYLVDRGLKKEQATMPPNPCGTRWNSWYRAVIYHKEHFSLYKDFIDNEYLASKCPPNSLEYLHKLFSKEDYESICVQVNIVATNCEPIIHLNDHFQSRKPNAVSTFDVMEDLSISFANNNVLAYDANSEAFSQAENVPYSKKQELLSVIQVAYSEAESKLTKYINGGQPAIKFFNQIRVFNPSRLDLMPNDKDHYSAIPGFNSVPCEELDLYFKILGPQVVGANPCITFSNIRNFWNGLQDRVPVLASLAMKYILCPTNSADVERCNSIYKLIHSGRRRSLSEESLKCLVFLKYNHRVLYDLIDSPDTSEGDTIMDMDEI